jgi:hypothetical protein
MIANELTKDEFVLLTGLLKRYAETQMDQWELWSFNTNKSRIYVSISMKPSGPEAAYKSLDEIIK